MDLKGKNAIVTGAAKRLGRLIALTLAERGMNVAIHYNQSEKEASELAETIQGMGRKAYAVKADCSKRKKIYSAMEKIAKEFGEIHLLVNNASIFGPSELSKIDDNEWDKYLDINLKAPFYFAQKFSEIAAPEAAKIINIADTYGASPSAKYIPYGVSKGGLIHLTKGLAKALAPKTLVNCICPGPLTMNNDDSEKENNKKAVTANLLQREGRPEEIIKTLLFLAENDYITGQAIFVDGGKSA
jgi:NAD(P)-dependent dehydrogenase (short-subunit alcohol dehydrogenase family)